jgi:hypothetical protein
VYQWANRLEIRRKMSMSWPWYRCRRCKRQLDFNCLKLLLVHIRVLPFIFFKSFVCHFLNLNKVESDLK